ncbi:MAG TPA: bifunctional metallophosphatase/5'-nucleotidase [Candidatus Limnocylindria bacterium]|nr:bifunctional metallophosphatase/5'-nucleotidase [Candidatus Limnocylindria bacterium]
MPVPDVGARSGRRRLLTLAVAAVTLSLVMPAGALAAKPPTTPPHAVNVQLLAINDFHGNLQPPTGSSGRVGVADSDTLCTAAGPATCVLAGGVAYLADDIKDLEATNPGNTLVVAAGDSIGGTPLISAAFHDEPTIEALNLLGLDISAVGNHEFDEGVDELLRIQNGGCHPTDGCQTGHTYGGANFDFLAANVVYKDTGEPILPASKVETIDGVKVGFIGLTLEGTNLIVSPAGIQDVNFLDEAATINAATADLRSQGVKTIVVLIHEGGAQSVGLNPGTTDTCTGMSGAIVDIVSNLDARADMVVSGHTHNAYNCRLPNSEGALIPVSSSSSFGRLVTDIDLKINAKSGRPMQIAVDNKIVVRDDQDAAAADLVSNYQTLVAPIANRVVGSITATITRAGDAEGESALGDVIADAQLAWSQAAGADIAFMNPGGIRTDLVFDAPVGTGGIVTFGEAFAVQPFNNLVVTQDMTGAQIKAVLEQQWAACTPPGRSQNATVILQVSAGFTYSYSESQACGSRISNMMLGTTPIDPAAIYQVTANNFLADGGDSFPAFAVGTNRVFAPQFDVDALAAYLGGPTAPIAPGPQNRITELP